MKFVSELYSDISERDIKTFAKVQQKLINRLEHIKKELKDRDDHE